MKLRAASTPIALIVLAAGAAAYAYIVDRHTVSDSDRAVRRRDLLPAFRVDEVPRVEIEHDGDAFALERGGAAASFTWTIVAARRERADAAAVDALLRELELATRL